MRRTTHITTHRSRARLRQPVSARRAPTYERTARASVLPEKLFNSRVNLAVVCPETALMYAVLEDAFLCFRQQFEADPRHIECGREAEDWFFSADSGWLFSFVSICHVLGLEPQYIRKKLKQWTPSRPLDIAPPPR